MRRSKRSEQSSNSNPTAQRVRVTFLFVTFLLVAIPALFVLDGGRGLLMPGPLTSAHSAIKECQICHTANGREQTSWLQGLSARNPHNDSVACLTCHKIDGRIAFYPHTATPQMLNGNLQRLRQVASRTPKPQTAKLRDIAFPMKDVLNSELNCATCHEEHKGAEFDMALISDAQCQSCHTVQFDSFDGNHPEFSSYPFKRRQRLKFNHTSHMTKHYPEVASKKEPGLRIPGTCSDCHNSNADRRQMAVQSFDAVCSSCHIDQITGAERATGPKGIAFLSLPGLDIQTLQEKGASIGEWPEFSEAELSPFMALMIGRTPEGAATLAQLEGLDLLDLTAASDEQINAATQLVWQIKGLFYTLLSGKASDVLAGLNASQSTPVNPLLIADLSANLPRDVIINAQIEWLPNLANEMQQRRASLDQQGSSWRLAMAEQKLSASATIDTIQPNSSLSASPREAVGKERIRIAQAASGGDDIWTIDANGRLIKTTPGAAPAENNAPAPAENNAPNPVPEAAAPPIDNQNANGINPAGVDANANAAPAAIPATGAASADIGNDVNAVSNDDAPVDDGNSAPTFSPIESSVDTESWAEYGGWYRRDFTIFYRPAGHKDKFIYAWLNMTGPFASNGSAASTIFDRLTQKDAQGQCSKCHSVDNRNNGGFAVNWSPSSLASKAVHFTKFVHEPHFAVTENDGCLTCHKLDRKADFAKTYEQKNPGLPSANFSKVKKELCINCHGAGNARQDCLLCHEYHVQDVITPILRTQLPRQ